MSKPMCAWNLIVLDSIRDKSTLIVFESVSIINFRPKYPRTSRIKEFKNARIW